MSRKFVSLKKFVVGASAALGMFMSMSSAHAYVMDQLIGSTDLTSHGADTELAWAEKVTGLKLVQDFKVDTSNNAALTAIADPNVSGQWYIDVSPATPGYFLLDFGTGNASTSIDTYLFKNVVEPTVLVFSNSQVNFLSGGCASGYSCNIGKLSHYVTYDGTGGGGNNGGDVPEPATVALMGLGLFGVAMARRKGAKGKAE